MVGELSQEECIRVLSENSLGRLASQADGEVYLIPLGFAWDGQRPVFETSMGKKIEMMRSNPRVCFQTDQIVSATEWKSVIVFGTFTELGDAEKPAAARLLIDKISSDLDEEGRSPRDVTPDKVGGRYEGVMFVIDGERITGRFERPE